MANAASSRLMTAKFFHVNLQAFLCPACFRTQLNSSLLKKVAGWQKEYST